MPERIQLSRKAGWRLPVGAVSVARPSRWGNPFPACEHRTRDQAVDQFARLLNGVVRGADDCEHVLPTFNYPARWEIRRELAGKDLACWCPLTQPCHADVLLRIANEVVPAAPGVSAEPAANPHDRGQA